PGGARAPVSRCRRCAQRAAHRRLRCDQVDKVGGADGRTWIHFDLGKVPEKSWFKQYAGGTTDTSSGITTVVELAHGVYAGTVDLILAQGNTRYDVPRADLGNQI